MPSSVLVLSDQDRATLESWTRSSTISAGQRERAEIVLAVADGTGVSGDRPGRLVCHVRR